MTKFLRATEDIQEARERIAARVEHSDLYTIIVAAILDVEDAKLQSRDAMGDPVGDQHTHVLREIYSTVQGALNK